MRYLGTFLTDPLDVPPLVTEHLAGQLRISDPACVARYAERRTTPLEGIPKPDFQPHTDDDKERLISGFQKFQVDSKFLIEEARQP